MTNTNASYFKPSNPTHHQPERAGIKKVSGNRPKQAGFFDLGLSLLILAIGGGAMYMTDRTQVENYASLQESTELTATLQNGNGNLTSSDIDIPNSDIDIPNVAVK